MVNSENGCVRGRVSIFISHLFRFHRPVVIHEHVEIFANGKVSGLKPRVKGIPAYLFY